MNNFAANAAANRIAGPGFPKLLLGHHLSVSLSPEHTWSAMPTALHGPTHISAFPTVQFHDYDVNICRNCTLEVKVKLQGGT